MVKKPTLVNFMYFNGAGRAKLHLENLAFFAKHAILEDSNVHYNFICNKGVGQAAKFIPSINNISIIERSNEGRDFGAYGDALKQSDIDNYEHFIFLNDTCVGPFLPTYLPPDSNWINLFTDKLDEKTKLVGPTFNGHKSPHTAHLQSYCFGTDKTLVKILEKESIFHVQKKHFRKNYLVQNHEIRLSQVTRKNNFLIKPFMLSGIAGQYTKKCPIASAKRYFGFTPNPIEVMFMKTNRQGMRPAGRKLLQMYIKWMNNKI